MTATPGIVYVAGSAALEVSHASVQVLGGTSQIGAHVAPSRRIKQAETKGWKRILREQGTPLLFFCPPSRQIRPCLEKKCPPTGRRRVMFKSQWQNAAK